jgi:UDP-N-acetylmuramate dehydrogenase
MDQPVLLESMRDKLRSYFGSGLKEGRTMDRYSVMGVGGPADFLIEAKSSQGLEESIRFLWENRIPFILLGAGSNTLISDKGIREVVVINKAKEIKYLDAKSDNPKIWAESGAGFGKLARLSGSKGWSGLEWSAGIPGTVGGAVVNNAGAFGSNVAENLEVAEILHQADDRIKRSTWSADQFAYDYRTSVIKSGIISAVVLNASFGLVKSTPEEVKGRISEIAEKRKSSQPQGSSLGSMFKNPPGDYAGRLIEEAGLKGTQIGGVEISQVHGNFFLNQGKGTADDIAELIDLTKKTVRDQFAVDLELEIQYIGDWDKEKP